MSNNKKLPGFTLVELLIVIVIIAILAAISIVTYNGIQQRANNAAITHNVESWVKALQLSYTTQGVIQTSLATDDRWICLGYESEYPADDDFAAGDCISGQASANSTVMNKIEEIANLSTVVEPIGGMRGLQYVYYDNQSDVYYRLFGTNQDCGLPGAEIDGVYDSYTECVIKVSDAIGQAPIAY